MKVTLVGPDGLGYWFLTDEKGIPFPLIERHEDHSKGATLLGWNAPDGVTDQEEIIDSALDWLMEHTGDDFEAPDQVFQFFHQLIEDDKT